MVKWHTLAMVKLGKNSMNFTQNFHWNCAIYIRLGLCTDGFNPFGMSSTSNSFRPVMLMVYNFAPRMCIKKEFIFLNMLILGPNNPRHNIDVCLWPLINELKQLWNGMKGL